MPALGLPSIMNYKYWNMTGGGNKQQSKFLHRVNQGLPRRNDTGGAMCIPELAGKGPHQRHQLLVRCRRIKCVPQLPASMSMDSRKSHCLMLRGMECWVDKLITRYTMNMYM